MKKTINPQNLLTSIFQEKCPRCNKGDVFVKNASILNLPVMHDDCSHCHYHFDREPGYFLGAMYLSYGFAVLQGIITFALCYYFLPALDTIWKAILVTAVIFIFGRKNYKLSRVLYIHIFPW